MERATGTGVFGIGSHDINKAYLGRLAMGKVGAIRQWVHLGSFPEVMECFRREATTDISQTQSVWLAHIREFVLRDEGKRRMAFENERFLRPFRTVWSGNVQPATLWLANIRGRFATRAAKTIALLGGTFKMRLRQDLK
jgi:hypothetical protein